METLGQTLKCLLVVRLGMECGESIRSTMGQFVLKNTTPYSILVREWLFYMDQKKDSKQLLCQLSAYERAFFEIVEAGINGQRVHERLVLFEAELLEKCRFEMEKEIDLLPFKLMIPLFLFQFPAYLILLLGPLLNNFLENLGG